ncbi:Alpha/beta hydrolase fold-1 [Phyllosticta citricarpa]|uniref:Alpha/beta hydrolase fold-1 n=1 Tax=Phyllosticta citricarpa TaxID=55181 RepID=A0ABR1L9K2_9PEZI
MASTPEIVFVPGAWQPSDCFDPIRAIFKEKGYVTHAVDHPSVGADPPTGTLEGDVASLRRLLEELIEEEEKEVVLLMHSYGGVVGSCASEGLGLKQRRAEAKKGGILVLIYQAAFAIPKGKSLMDMLPGGEPLPWMRNDDGRVSIEVDASFAMPDLPPVKQQKWHARLTHTSAGVFIGKSTCEPWHEIPTAYFICEGDTILQPAVQEMMAGSLGNISIKRNPGAHSAFISYPEINVEQIEEAVREAREKL